MTLRAVNLSKAFAGIDDYWRPRIGGDINEAQIKLAKFKGEFVWHHHDVEDELFLVISGQMLMKLRTGDVLVAPGEYLIVPRGVEHCPVAVSDEVHVVLLEPRTTLNTGNVANERTVRNLARID
jgi:mannose-6-phosphate isomerase-like protein (cupin superfamily)